MATPARLVTVCYKQCSSVASGSSLPSTAPSSMLRSSFSQRRQLHTCKHLLQGQLKPAALSPDAAAQAVKAAQSRVFGTVFGDAERSGRKRLRALLKGTQKRNWYGFSVDDIFPGLMTETKEFYFRDEEMLNRLGKTRIKGKMKDPLKSTIDTMKFDDMVDDLVDSQQPMKPEDLLLEPERELRQQQLASAKSAAEVAAIEARYAALIGYRERNWDAMLAGVEDKLKGAGLSLADAGEEAEATGEDGKKKKKQLGSFKTRAGLQDKRLWGEEADEVPRKASGEDLSKGSPARDTAAPGAAAGTPADAGAAADASKDAEGAEEGEAVEEVYTTETLSKDSDPVVAALAQASVWAIDPRLVEEARRSNGSPATKKAVEEAYKEFATARAKATWAALEVLKTDPLYRSVYGEFSAMLRNAGQAVTAEGVTAWMMSPQERRGAELEVLERAASGVPFKARSETVAPSPTSAASAAPQPAAAEPAAAAEPKPSA